MTDQAIGVTLIGLMFAAVAVLAWRKERRDYHQRAKSETRMVRTISERFDREWVPISVIRRWESWN